MVLDAIDEKGKVTNLIDGIEIGDDYTNEIEYFASQLSLKQDVSYCAPAESARAIKIAYAMIESADKKGDCVIL
jgi:hypothetical protein